MLPLLVHLHKDHTREIEEVKKFNEDFQIVLWDEQTLRDMVEKAQAELLQKFPDKFAKLRDYYDNACSESKYNLGRMVVLYMQGGVSVAKHARSVRNLRPLLLANDSKTGLIVSEQYHQTFLSHFFVFKTTTTSPLISTRVIIANERDEATLYIIEQILDKLEQANKYTFRFDMSRVTGEHVFHLTYRNFPEKFVLLPSSVLDSAGVQEDTYFIDDTQNLAKMYSYTPVFAAFFLVLVTFILSKCGPVWLVLVFSGVLCGFLTFFVYAHHGGYVADNFRSPLPDKGFALVPYTSNKLIFYAVDWAPQMCICVFFLVLFSRPKKQQLLTAFFSGLLMIWNFKISIVQLTGIPVPITNPEYFSSNEFLIQDFWRKKEESVICGNPDMMFSGHTSSSLFAVLFILHMLNAPVLVRVVVFCFFALFIVGLISIRFHYSMDIAVGIVVGISVFLHSKNWLQSNRDFFLSDYGKLYLLSIVASIGVTCFSYILF